MPCASICCLWRIFATCDCGISLCDHLFLGIVDLFLTSSFLKALLFEIFQLQNQISSCSHSRALLRPVRNSDRQIVSFVGLPSKLPVRVHGALPECGLMLGIYILLGGWDICCIVWTLPMLFAPTSPGA